MEKNVLGIRQAYIENGILTSKEEFAVIKDKHPRDVMSYVIYKYLEEVGSPLKINMSKISISRNMSDMSKINEDLKILVVSDALELENIETAINKTFIGENGVNILGVNYKIEICNFDNEFDMCTSSLKEVDLSKYKECNSLLDLEDTCCKIDDYLSVLNILEADMQILINNAKYFKERSACGLYSDILSGMLLDMKQKKEIIKRIKKKDFN